MKFEFSRKSNSIEGGIFNILNDKKKELLNKGMKVYNFSIGTPDFQPAQHIMEAMQEACKNPQNYKYAIDEKPELVQAMIDYYKNRFGVTLAENEIMTVYGSQEGMAHLGWAICDPGDLVLVPNPGYPIFSIGPMFCDAQIYEYPIYPEDNYMLKFENIPEEIAKKAKMIVVSYPLNPVCAVADDAFYEKLIAFAKKYNIIVLHDNAYADIVYGGRVGKSFLEYEGAKDVGIEFYSLSKTYNMTGMRISFTVGNAEIISQFKKVRSQIDYGIFPAIQLAAVAALTGPQDMVKEQCAEYERRNKALCGGLREIGWNVPDSQGSMFVWAPIPEGFNSSEKFVLELMEKSGVIVVPGTAFGSLGEGYVRFALVYPVEVIKEAVQAIADSGILK
ncbi:MAG: aminotransferase class I/II-fold pyridoxal phosphate-dependent enzyme [Lachnospiraceae bacterium]|nr:aminotransferase class I/II-fold pyridoxal phosphate-dependent enzyme [Lachnospiraceae bacterium]